MKLRRNCRRKQHKPQRGTSDSGCAALFRSNFFKKALDSPTVIPYMIKASSKSLCEVAFMLKIGEFSKLSRLSVRMLRYYDASGLLTPAVVDPFTGLRRTAAHGWTDRRAARHGVPPVGNRRHYAAARRCRCACAAAGGTPPHLAGPAGHDHAAVAAAAHRRRTTTKG